MLLDPASSIGVYFFKKADRCNNDTMERKYEVVVVYVSDDSGIHHMFSMRTDGIWREGSSKCSILGPHGSWKTVGWYIGVL